MGTRTGEPEGGTDSTGGLARKRREQTRKRGKAQPNTGKEYGRANKQGRRVRSISEHIHIRLVTRMEDIEATAAEVEEGLRILRKLIRQTHIELREKGKITERTHDELVAAA